MIHSIGRGKLPARKEIYRRMIDNRLVFIVIVLIIALSLVKPAFLKIAVYKKRLCRISPGMLVIRGSF